MLAEQKEPVIIFLHIPKTAGTTLRRIIQDQYKPGTIYELYGFSSMPSNKRIDKLNKIHEVIGNKKIKVINSHLGFGLHNYLRTPCEYITFLRNPINRVISYYYFLKSKYKSRYDGITLEMFVEKYGRANNSMTKFLSGEQLKIQTDNLANECVKQTNNDMLDVAKKHLRNNIKVFGITERFYESLILFREELGWEIPYYENQNVAKKSYSAKNISEDTIELIRRCNELDIQLYDYALTLFNEKIKFYGNYYNNTIKLCLGNNQNISSLSYRIKTSFNQVMHEIYGKML